MGSEETKYNEIQTWTINNNLDSVYKTCHLTPGGDNTETPTTACEEDNGKILNGLPDELMNKHIQRYSSSSYDTTTEATKMDMVTRFDAGNTLTKDSPSDLYGPLHWNSVKEDFFGDGSVTNGFATVRPSLPSERLIYQCLHCPKTFTSEKYLRMHLALHKTWLPDWDHCKNVAIVKPTVKVHCGAGGVASGGATGGPGGGQAAGGTSSQWSCNVCGKSFAQNSNYKNHIRTHSEERPFVCDICCIGFKERYHLKKHTLFKHTRELNEQCGHCGKRFKDSTAVRAHERIHSDARPYICIRCGKAFKTSECLWHHDHRSKTCGRQQSRNVPVTIKHHHQQQHGYIAHIPDGRGRYNTKASAVNHQFIGSGFIACRVGLDIANTKWPRAFRKNDPHGQSPISHLTPPLISDFQPQPLATNHIAYPNPGHQITDMKFELKDPNDFSITSKMMLGNCQSRFEASLQSPLETGKGDSSGSTKNTTCQSIIGAKDGPVKQVGSYDGDGGGGGTAGGGGGKKRAICMTCGKHFVSAPAFNKHMLMHSESRPYRCTICDIGFKLKVHLKKHNLYRHNSDYPCKCSVCGKRFKDSSAVRLHERIHSNERPFQCQCGKSFKTRENLWGHRHRRPCLKYTLEQSGETCQKRRKTDLSRTADELQLEPKTEVTGGEMTSPSMLMKTLSPEGTFFGPVGGGDLCSTMTDSLGAEYGFQNDRKTMSSDYQDMLAPETLDVKPVIPMGLRHFQEAAIDPYQMEKIASSIIKDANISPSSSSSSCSSSFCSSSSTAAAVAAAAMAYNLSAHDADSSYQMNNSLPPFETLISALRSCAGYSLETPLPESSQSLSFGHQAKLLDGSCFVDDRIVSDGLYAAASCGWSSAPHGASTRQHLARNSSDDLPVVDLSMQQQQSSGMSYLAESFSTGPDVVSDHSLISGGDCGGSMRSQHLAPILYWDDEPWLDQRLLLTPSLANTGNVWHDADNLLTDLSVKQVAGLL